MSKEHKYAKQSGGRGQYGHVFIKLEPKEPGSGYEFVNEISGGVILKNISLRWIRASKKRCKMAFWQAIGGGF